MEKQTLEHRESRCLAKRILNTLALPTLAAGGAISVAPLAVPALSLPPPVRVVLQTVIPIYQTAPVLADATALQHAWYIAWEYSAGSAF